LSPWEEPYGQQIALRHCSHLFSARTRQTTKSEITFHHSQLMACGECESRVIDLWGRKAGNS